MKDVLQKIDQLLNRGDIKKADILTAKNLRTDLIPSERAELLLRRARIRLMSARPDDALLDLTAVREIAPHTGEKPETLELLGDIYFARFELAVVGFADRQDTLLAQQAYEQIIQIYPRYFNLGWIYYQLGRIQASFNKTDEAARFFQQALLSPTHVSTLTAYCYERLGFITFYERRDLEQALAFLNRAVDTYPSTADRNWLIQVHILRSRVLRGMRDYQAALATAETALSIVSGAKAENKFALSEVLLTIAELLLEIGGRDRDVVTTLQQFMQNTRKPLGVDVTWARVNEMLGNAYLNLGQYDNAVSAYRSVLQFNPDYPWEMSLYERIARCYYQQRAYEEAVQVLQQMLDTSAADGQMVSDYQVYDLLGNALFAVGRYEQAIQAYQTALQLAPPNADTLQQIRSYYNLARERV